MGRTDNKTQRITQGALLSAIFAALVLINRQTGGVAQGILVYAYALPITIYTAWYGLKISAAAAVAMALLSFLLGTPTYAFYSCTSLAIGIVFGECLYKKVSAEKTILWVIMAAILVNMLDLVFTTFVYGVSLETEATQVQHMMQESMTTAQEKLGSSMDETMVTQLKTLFTIETLRKILLLSKALSGVVQGFLTYLIGSLVMRKLKIKVPKPKSLSELRPPAWTGYVALACFLILNMFMANLMQDESKKSVCLVLGSVFYIYLIVFGVVGAYVLMRKYVTRSKAISVIVSILAALVLPYVMMLLGFAYLVNPGELFTVDGDSEEKKIDEVH